MTDSREVQEKCCRHCGVNETVYWRKGPKDKPVLCNACGVRWLTKRTFEGYLPKSPGSTRTKRVSSDKPNASLKSASGEGSGGTRRPKVASLRRLTMTSKLGSPQLPTREGRGGASANEKASTSDKMATLSDLREVKEALDAGLVSQADFDDVKRDYLRAQKEYQKRELLAKEEFQQRKSDAELRVFALKAIIKHGASIMSEDQKSDLVREYLKMSGLDRLPADSAGALGAEPAAKRQRVSAEDRDVPPPGPLTPPRALPAPAAVPPPVDAPTPSVSETIETPKKQKRNDKDKSKAEGGEKQEKAGKQASRFKSLPRPPGYYVNSPASSQSSEKLQAGWLALGREGQRKYYESKGIPIPKKKRRPKYTKEACLAAVAKVLQWWKDVKHRCDRLPSSRYDLQSYGTPWPCARTVLAMTGKTWDEVTAEASKRLVMKSKEPN